MRELNTVFIKEETRVRLSVHLNPLYTTYTTMKRPLKRVTASRDALSDARKKKKLKANKIAASDVTHQRQLK